MTSPPRHAAQPASGAVVRSARLRQLVWLGPAALTLVVTLYRLDRAQLWRDELATWSAASRSPGDLLRMVGNIDAVSGPYYLFMHLWIRLFGDSVPALRLPAVLAMTATAGLTAVLGRLLFDARTGLIAGLLFAIVPSTSRYGQEARSYAFATLLAVLATLLLVRALDRPTWGRWVGYGATAAALGLAHLVAATLLAGHALVLLRLQRRTGDRRLLRGLAAVAAAGLVLAPLALLGRGQHSGQLDWVDRATLGDLPGLPGAVLQAGAVGGMLLGLAALGLASRGPWAARLGLFVLLPTVLLFVAGLVAPLWVPRYLVFLVPFGCLLAASVLAPLPMPAALPIVAVMAVLGASAQLDLRRTHEWPRSQQVDYARAARIIGERDRPGDGIVYSPRDGWKFLDTAIAYHLRADRPRDVLAVRDQVREGSLWATECAQPADCLAAAERIWLLVTGERADPLRSVPEPKAGALRAGFRVAQVWQVHGLTVALLTRGHPA